MEAAAAAMDFHTLSRRELQALCKRNGIRANMTNVAMADALQGLTSVDGIDEIGTTLCLPTPGRSVMKSAAKMVPVEEQQHGSPLPRGRRVSVKSPEAIRMEVEGGEEDGVKEIVKTPGVALRSTRRGARATPAPLPTPAPAGSTRATARRNAARKTVEVVPTPATRRSQRTASRKAAGAEEAGRAAEDVPEEKTSKMTIALDQEAEVVAATSKEEKVQEDEPKAALSDEKCDDPNEEEKVRQEEPKAALSDEKCDDPDEEEKVHQEEPKAVASDVKCDDPEEEVTKFLDGDSKEEELEEADSSDATTGSAALLIKSCNDPKVEEVVVVLEEHSTTPHEGIVKEEAPTSVDSPILGVIEKEQDASVEDCEDLAAFSPAREMTDEINPAEIKEVVISEEPVTKDKEVAISEEALTEDKVVAINEEAVKEDSFANTFEADPAPKEILLTAAGKDETVEEGADDEMPQAGKINEEDEENFLTELKQGAADKVVQAELELADNETSEEDEDGLSEEDEDDLSEEDEDDLSEEIEGADAEMPQAGEISELDEENFLTELKQGAAGKVVQAELELADNETSEEDEDGLSEEDEDDLSEEIEGADAKMLQGEEDLDEDEEWASDDDQNTEEIGSTVESDEDTDKTIGALQMLQGTGMAEEANKDAFFEDDDFSGDLPPECDKMMIFSDGETESDIASPVLEENQAAVASATKSAKSQDDSAIEQEEGPEEADATEEVDNIVKSLDEFTFKEGESEEMQKQQPQDYNSMSLRKLKSTYKKLITAKQEGKQEEVTEGKRLPLEEMDENACINH